MKLQKATRFGLYAVLELAADPGAQRSAGEIAQKYGISTNHLAKVLRSLGRAGLVDAVRGAGGGYRFTGNARRVTLLDIVELFEETGPAGPEVDDAGAATPLGETLHSVLVEIDDITRATLGSITVESFINLMRKGKRPAAAERKSLSA
jgi:Rrf2 family protein